MIIGSHSYVFTDRWTDESVTLLGRMRGMGVECLDIGIGDDVVYTPELTGRRAAELGIGLALRISLKKRRDKAFALSYKRGHESKNQYQRETRGP